MICENTLIQSTNRWKYNRLSIQCTLSVCLSTSFDSYTTLPGTNIKFRRKIRWNHYFRENNARIWLPWLQVAEPGDLCRIVLHRVRAQLAGGIEQESLCHYWCYLGNEPQRRTTAMSSSAVSIASDSHWSDRRNTESVTSPKQWYCERWAKTAD